MGTIYIKKKYFLVLLPIFFSIGAFFYTDYEKNNDYKEVQSILFRFLKGNDEVTAYDLSKVQGNLIKDQSNYFSTLTAKNQVDDSGKPLTEIFHLEKGGWSVVNLKKASDNRVMLTEHISLNMGYKVPEYNVVKTDFDEFSMPIEDRIPTNRDNVQDVYEKSVKFILDKNKNLQKDSYGEIKYFNKPLATKYYSIKEDDLGEQIKDGYIYDSQSIVFYKTKLKEFYITYNENSYYERLAMNIGISLIISAGIYLLFKYKPIIKITD